MEYRVKKLLTKAIYDRSPNILVMVYDKDYKIVFKEICTEANKIGMDTKVLPVSGDVKVGDSRIKVIQGDSLKDAHRLAGLVYTTIIFDEAISFNVEDESAAIYVLSRLRGSMIH